MNINTAKIKYVVAREGLIIVSLLICMAISLYIDSWKFDKLDSYTNTAMEVSLTKKTISNPFDAFYGTKPDIFDKVNPEPNAQFLKSTPYELVKRTLDKDFPSSNPGEYIVWDKAQNVNVKIRYDDKGNKLFTGFPWNIDFKNRVTLFLFLVYPTYLLIRFIIWASLTVRNKK